MELQYFDGRCDTGLPVPWDPGRVPGNKKPRAVSGRGIKKSHGPVAPAHGFGYSSWIVLKAADRRRDWHPGGGSSVMRHLSELHEPDSFLD